MVRPEEVLAFWLDEVGTEGWYRGGEELDAEIRRRFEPSWQALEEGALSLWLTYPTGTLAYIILADQFSRNMYRGTPKAFSTDEAARSAAKQAIARGWDLRIDEPARQFFYMPLMHSECLADQERCVRLLMSRMPQTGAMNLPHARAHREVIRRFGRFPYRNEALSRATREGEASYLSEGGYGSTIREIEAAA